MNEPSVAPLAPEPHRPIAAEGSPGLTSLIGFHTLPVCANGTRNDFPVGPPISNDWEFFPGNQLVGTPEDSTMKRAKSIAVNCAWAFALFLGVCGYHLLVNNDLRRGAVTGLVAVCLYLLVHGIIGLFRRKRQAE